MKRSRLIAIALMTFSIFSFGLEWNILGGIFVILLLAVILNGLLRKYISKANASIINFMKDNQRNFDAIVIGQPIAPCNQKRVTGKRILYFTHKGRTIFASYLFLIHQYSYLREDGNGIVYIVSSTRDKRMYARLVDVYSFHPVIKSRLKVGWSLNYPILFWARNFGTRHYFIDGKDIPLRDRIEQFCRERKIRVEFINQ